MKLETTRIAVTAYSAALQAAGAHVVAAGLRELAKFLADFPDKQMSELTKCAGIIERRGVATSGAGDNTNSVAQVALQLDHIAKIATATGSKPTQLKDLTSLAGLLRVFPESEKLSTVVQQLRDAMTPVPAEQLIARFIERLTNELRTASFDRTYAELERSPLKREHLVAVATSVYGPIKRDTSRSEALKYIRKPHDAFMSAKRGIDATGGRSAA